MGFLGGYLGLLSALPVMYLTFIYLFGGVGSLLMIIARWRIYEKAGKPGWAAIIPIYSTLVMLEIIERPWWWIFLQWTVVMPIIMIFDLASVFGKDAGFGFGLLILPYIFNPILGFGDAEYIGAYEHPNDMIDFVPPPPIQISDKRPSHRDEPARPRAVKVQAWLTDGSGKNYQLNKGRTRIGRLSENDVCVSSPTVGRRHAMIEEQRGHFRITDLASKNHTYVNGKPVREPVILHPNDEIRFGDSYTVRFVAPGR